MCGIVGYIGEGLGSDLLVPLLASMRHRGPDGDGEHHDGPVHMGMRRLSVIDLAHGWQPLLSRDGQVIAFQNGEIYNYRALRSELTAVGYAFKSQSDTEVLAHGYAHWGIDGLLSRVDGMYAIAIYDRASGELHLARDRFGEKPLFYSSAPGRFGYASTLLAASSFPWVGDSIDRVALDQYLALHFIPGARTYFTDVHQVLPGERLTICINTLEIARNRYYIPKLTRPRDITDEVLTATLEEAVSSRLVSDVPVGVFLSGGLDSSLVAALAARANPSVATFSMGFSDARMDESAHATAVAKHIGVTHHTFHFDQGSFNSLLPKVAAALDTPIGDQALLPLYWLSSEARKYVTVVLAGEGADEIFAGYSYYTQFTLHKNWRGRVRSGANCLWRWLAPSARRESLLHDDPLETPSGFPLLTSRAERNQLLGETGRASDIWQPNVLAWMQNAHGPLQLATAADIATWLPDDLLVKFDRMAMAHSLEGRAPFLAPKVVEMGLALRPSERMTASLSKVALRRIAGRYLPADILARPKQGFVLPMGRWITEWFLAWGGVAAYFAQRSVPGLDVGALCRIVEADLENGMRRERMVFAIIMLAEWWHDFNVRRRNLRSLS